MSYDMYNDPMNPVRKQGKPDLGKDSGYHVQGGSTGGPYEATDEVPFEYGSGRDISINTPDDGVAEGTTSAYEILTNWDADAADDATESAPARLSGR